MTPSSTEHPADTLPGNDPILTDAEKALAAEIDTPAGESAPAQATEPGDPEAPPAGEPAAAAEPAAADPQPQPLITAPEARDFKAEREAIDARYQGELGQLKDRFNSGDLDDDEYETERERVIQARQDERDNLTVDRVKYETRAELAQDFANQSWQQNVKTFLADPENAIIGRSVGMQKLWQDHMQTVVNEAGAAGQPPPSDLELMAAARTSLMQELGLSAAPKVEAPASTKPTHKAPKLDDLPPSMGTGPGASPGIAATTEELAGMEITALEQQMAGMSEAQMDKLLRSTAGAFVD